MPVREARVAPVFHRRFFGGCRSKLSDPLEASPPVSPRKDLRLKKHVVGHRVGQQVDDCIAPLVVYFMFLMFCPRVNACSVGRVCHYTDVLDILSCRGPRNWEKR